jgi:hypothetical protein
MRKLRQLILGICLVACIGILLPFGSMVDTGVLAFHEFLGGLFAVDDSDTDIKAHAKGIPLKNLQEMLTYTNPVARAFAARALGHRAELAAVPDLIQSLNDTLPFRERNSREHTSLGAISKKTLVSMLKAQIGREPENIAVLMPFFGAAERGSSAERKSVTEILGEIREPLARPLLLEISKDRDQELLRASKTSLAELDSYALENSGYWNLRNTQVRVVLSSVFLVALLLWSIIHRLRKGAQTQLILLSVVPVVLLGSFAAVIVGDFSKGKISEQAVDAAIRNQDIIKLRTMNYHDVTPYPGDSYIARYLLKSCNEDVIRCLISLPLVQTTDDETATKLTEIRTRWILARYVASGVGTPLLDSLVNSEDAAIRLAVAMVLGKLGVRNNYITDALARLAKDEDLRVRKAADEASARVRGYPVWLEYVPSS